MPRKRKATSSKSAKRRSAAPREQAPVKEGAPPAGRVIERPDGFYWEAKKGDPHGPFETRAEAEADLLADGATEEEDDVEVPGALQEAESELGLNDWIDPDTGGPAEDNIPHIEDH
jgi:hypothetical protein